MRLMPLFRDVFKLTTDAPHAQPYFFMPEPLERSFKDYFNHLFIHNRSSGHIFQIEISLSKIRVTGGYHAVNRDFPWSRANAEAVIQSGSRIT
jgi:hypothetical protein